MPTCFLILGSNLGDKIARLNQSRQAISENIGTINRKSGIYQTAPWGFSHHEYFLNQVVEVETNLPAHEVLKQALQIEEKLGRTRNSGEYEARTIDIDILFYNHLQMETGELIIPHPRLHLRRFVLVPLSEIAPEYRHPALSKTVSELLKECPDKGEVKLINETN